MSIDAVIAELQELRRLYGPDLEVRTPSRRVVRVRYQSGDSATADGPAALLLAKDDE